jgi:ribonuclease HI
MTYDPYALTIHIDGSTYDNPGGSGGIAGIVEFPDKLNREPEQIFIIGFDSTTNNRMELTACIQALMWARDNWMQFQPGRVLVISDSRYVCDNLPYARNTWKTNEWCNSDGRPVENADLWKLLLSLLTKIGVRTEIEWKKGKSTPVQVEVDKQAKGVAKAAPRRKDRGFVQAKIARTKLPGISADLFPAQGQEEVIRIYKKDGNYSKKLSQARIRFEVFSVEKNTYVSKNYAYTSLEIESKLHRSHLYRVQFNTNPKYPIIEAVLGEFVTD